MIKIQYGHFPKFGDTILNSFQNKQWNCTMGDTCNFNFSSSHTKKVFKKQVKLTINIPFN